VKTLFYSLVVGSILLASCGTRELQSHSVIATGMPEASVSVVNEEAIHSNCPADMVEIEGNYCPVVQQKCLHWRNAPGERCEEWENPVKCVSTMVKKHYCIDRYEFPNKEGQVPQDWMSWYDAKNACEAVGKRLCTHAEWTYAAEGPKDMHPYPYGDGFHRDSTICNFDRKANIKIFRATNKNTPEAKALRALLVPSGSMKDCVSDWGVFDMVGNVDEWVVNESGRPYVSSLVGGHVFGVRNASRPSTDGHFPGFSWYETGTRCCKDTE
jgi:sulfatase modifying factor 1